MAEYIDVQDLIKNIPELPVIDVVAMLNYVGGLPAADVAPVRYGQWVYDEYEYAHCSECGFEFEDREFVTPYCPNCGAKMEGGSE